MRSFLGNQDVKLVDVVCENNIKGGEVISLSLKSVQPDFNKCVKM